MLIVDDLVDDIESLVLIIVTRRVGTNARDTDRYRSPTPARSQTVKFPKPCPAHWQTLAAKATFPGRMSTPSATTAPDGSFHRAKFLNPARLGVAASLASIF
ncbi:hypothetical protein [Burkholderia multivorans]|uniref:hypothetical protein n=1 Tax=Burkholderia multivorans TaxID=87883 RepID=UPI001C24BD93|nr:hypothetical protein [Burkholderia multivorans]MCA8143883.1 hypothetical protein [Burkholderia multivorans]